ncbi:MAG: PaaI family thioesterase [Rubrivivax sp.]|nr:PaaI family thioesterase [Rubrivivax sp.]
MTSTSLDELNARGRSGLPGHLGMVFTAVQAAADGGEVQAEMRVQPHLMAPNGFLHAGSLVSLADTCCGYGCVQFLPPGARGFTTVELKSNHLGTARDGTVRCVARPVHVGRTTQVWDATLTHAESGRTLVVFRCTQLVLAGS